MPIRPRNKWGCNNIIHCSRHYYCCHHRIYAIPKLGQNVSAYRNKLGSTSPITPDIKVGDMGVTLSRLNPMGKIIVGIHTIEARADNELIDEDTPVKIIRIEPTVVIVCKETENEKTGNNINTSKQK